MAKKEPTKKTLYLIDPDDIRLILDHNHPDFNDNEALYTENDLGDPDHPLYDPRVHVPVKDVLVENLQKYGNLQPISVLKLDGYFTVIDGRHRVLAARKANKDLIEAGSMTLKLKCEVKKGAPKKHVGAITSSNELRFEDSYVNRAKKITERMEIFGHSVEEIAEDFGKSVQTILNWAKINDLDSTVKAAITQKLITPTAAIKLHDLPAKKQITKLEKLLAKAEGKKISIADTEKETKEEVENRKSYRPFKKKELKDIDEEIEKYLKGTLADRIGNITETLKDIPPGEFLTDPDDREKMLAFDALFYLVTEK